jgi:hypothetical protein
MLRLMEPSAVGLWSKIPDGVGAWASILALTLATLTQVGFVYSIYYMLAPLLMRPRMRTYAHLSTSLHSQSLLPSLPLIP